MSLEKWEEQMKDSLESFTPSDSSNWDGFETRFNSEIGAINEGETPFDRNVRDKLSNVSAGKSNWALLEANWIQYLKRRRNYLLSKSIELCLLILLIFTFNSGLPSLNESALNESALNESALNESALHESALHESALHESAVHESAVHESAVNESAVNESAVNESAVNESVVNESAVNKSAVNDLVAKETKVSDSGISKKSAIEAITINPIISRPATSSSVTSSSVTSDLMTSNRDKLKLVDTRNIGLLKRTPTDLKIEELELPQVEIDPSPTKNGRTFVQVFAAPTMNFVTTPTVEVVGIPGASGYNEAELGFRTGVKVSRDFDKFSFGTGFEFSKIKYDNRNIVRILEIVGGEVEETVESYQQLSPQEFNYSIISLPLEAKYFYRKSDDAALYVMLGVNLSYVANFSSDLENNLPNFDVNKIVYNSNVIGELPNNFTTDFGNKFFGSLKVGIGIEKDIDYNNRYFIQPSYQHMIGSGVGYVNDKIGSFSMEFGLKRKI